MKPTIQQLKDNKRLGNSRMIDEVILPPQYSVVSEPYYKGDGVHSIHQLQEICKQFQEYCHQQAVIKQEMINFINKS